MLARMSAVKPVDGKGTCRQVRTPEDVRAALSRVHHDERVLATVTAGLTRPQSAVFLWGTRGVAVLTILQSEIDGDFAWITYLQNEPGYSLKHEIDPVLTLWAEVMGVSRLAAAVDRAGPWEKLTGYTPWKLVISKEF